MSAHTPSAEFDNAGEDKVLEDIYDTADLVRSFAVSIREAAFRRDQIWTRIHRVEFIEQARLLSGLIKDLAHLAGERGAR
jgi:hypothetical protein